MVQRLRQTIFNFS